VASAMKVDSVPLEIDDVFAWTISSVLIDVDKGLHGWEMD